MEAYSTSQQPTFKLKDSCDVCSSSKLRCDKQKPTCSRCANLNRHCTYSPARRAGRPHRVRKDNGRSKSQSQNSSQDSEYTRSQCQQQSNNQRQAFAARKDAGSAAVVDTHMAEPPTITTQQIDGDSNDWLSRLVPRIGDGQIKPAGFPASPCTRMSPESLHLKALDNDCTKISLSMIERLEARKRRHSIGPREDHRGKHANDDDSNNDVLTATLACQRLLTILMCPCSEQAAVALLVASACVSLMDSARDSKSAGAGQVSAADAHGELDVNMWSQHPMQSPPHFMTTSSGRDGVNGSQSQVGDLSKIAKVVLQFVERYGQVVKGGARWEHTTWIVAPVATLLRCKLQSVTQGAARQLVT